MPNEFFKTPKSLHLAESEKLPLSSKMFYELRDDLFVGIGRLSSSKRTLSEISQKLFQQKTIWDLAFTCLITYRKWIELIKIDPFSPKKPEDLAPLDLTEFKEGLIEIWQQLHLDNNSELSALKKLLDKNLTIVYLIFLLFPEYGLEILKEKTIMDISAAVKNPKVFTNRELLDRRIVHDDCLTLITKLLGQEKIDQIDSNLDLREPEPKAAQCCLIL